MAKLQKLQPENASFKKDFMVPEQGDFVQILGPDTDGSRSHVGRIGTVEDVTSSIFDIIGDAYVEDVKIYVRFSDTFLNCPEFKLTNIKVTSEMPYDVAEKTAKEAKEANRRKSNFPTTNGAIDSAIDNSLGTVGNVFSNIKKVLVIAMFIFLVLCLIANAYPKETQMVITVVQGIVLCIGIVLLGWYGYKIYKSHKFQNNFGIAKYITIIVGISVVEFCVFIYFLASLGFAS